MAQQCFELSNIQFRYPVAIDMSSRSPQTRQANLTASTGHAPSEQAAVFLSLLAQYRTGRIHWIKRKQNLAGIALESRRAL